MRATCPNDPTHETFVTVAHVSEDWLVDRNGSFIESCGTLETVADPDPGNLWTCRTCGAEANVSE